MGQVRLDPLLGPPHLVDALLEAALQRQDAFDDLELGPQLGLLEGLLDEGIGAGVQRVDQARPLAASRHQDDGQVALPLHAPRPLTQLDAGHARHHPVGDQDVHVGIGLEHLPGLDARQGAGHPVTLPHEALLEQAAPEALIVGNEDAHPLTLRSFPPFG